MKDKIKKWLREFVLTLITDRIEEVKRSAVRASSDLVLSQLAALQAIDVNFGNNGKVIILAHVDGRDMVKIIETLPRMTHREYTELVKEIEMRYGARLRFQDLPMGYPRI